jgi:hypothetical protein
MRVVKAQFPQAHDFTIDQPPHPLRPMDISGGGEGPPLYRSTRSFSSASTLPGSTHWHLVKVVHVPEKKDLFLSQ